MARGFNDDQLYQFAVQQMVAESYLDGISLTEPVAVTRRLKLGNNASQSNGFGGILSEEEAILPGATRLSQSQITEFLNRYEIRDHHANDATGFSATLIFDKVTRQYTLSIRSTEFASPAKGGDSYRDIGSGITKANPAGADIELAKDGYALAQISAMEEYFKRLKESGKLGSTDKYNVTGYSLGGHLATVFAELHEADTNFIKAYVFNGAGRGSITLPGLSVDSLIGLYRQIMASPRAGFEAVLKQLRAAGLSSQADSLRVSFLGRVLQAESESAYNFRTDGGVSAASIYTSNRHKLAMQVLDPLMDSLTWVSIFGGNPVAPEVAAKMQYLFGSATHDDDSLTSNGGVTVDSNQRQWLFIEDQPNFYGDGGLLPKPTSEPGYTSGDFLRTHSITLLADSLALMNVFSRADSNLSKLQIETVFAASSAERANGTPDPVSTSAEANSLENALYALEKVISRTPASVTRIVPNRSGDGFGDLTKREEFYQRLKQIGQRLNELAGSEVNATGLSIVPLIGMEWVPINNSFARATGLGSLTVRANPLDVAFIISKAKQGDREGLAYRYALRELAPFVVLGLDYSVHNQGGELDRSSAGNQFTNGMTDAYIADRAAFLTWKLKLNIDDLALGVSTDNTPWLMRDVGASVNVGLAGSQAQFDAISNQLPLDSLKRDRAVVDGFAVQASFGTTRLLTFGSDRSDAVTGRAASDRLYGGSGSDYFEGRVGNDYLEGGAGTDIYQFNATRANSLTGLGASDDGNDLIRDTDGKGVIRITDRQASLLGTPTELGSALVAGAYVADTAVPNRWVSLDGRVVLDKVAGTNDDGTPSGRFDLVVSRRSAFGVSLTGTVTIRDWREGDFSIRLVAATPPADPVFTRTIEGGEIDPAGTADNLGNPAIHPGTKAANVANTLNGSAGADKMDGGGGDDDLRGDRAGTQPLANGPGDWLIGGDGRDWIRAGGGSDLIEGGADGNYPNDVPGDFIEGGAGDDRIFGATRIALKDAIVQGDGAAFPDKPGAQLASGRKGDFAQGGLGDDTLVSTAGNDILFGGGGRDTLIGGAGDDVLFGDANVRVGGGWVATPTWSVLKSGRAYVLTPDQVSAAAQSTYRTYFNHVDIDLGVSDPQPGAADLIYGGAGNDLIAGEAGDDFIDGGSGDDIINGGAGADVISGGAGSDAITGDDPDDPLAQQGGDIIDAGEGNDYVFGMGGDDVIFGGAGDDWLEGGVGSDILVGGPGRDFLRGGTGKDTYLFNRGDGVEIISNVDDQDGNLAAQVGNTNPDRSVIVFGEGIARSDVKFRRGSLLIDLGQGDAVHLELPDGQGDPAAVRSFDRLEFADGAVMSFDDVLAQGFDIDGTERIAPGLDANGNAVPGQDGNDTLIGTVNTLSGDRIRGFSGDDTLIGLAGDDWLNGGRDNDRLFGGAGNDTYVLTEGDGTDYLNDADGASTLSFGPGVAASSLALLVWRGLDSVSGRVSDFLTIGYGTRGDSVTIVDGLAHGDAHYVFADGTVLDQAALLARLTQPLTLNGTALADTLYGGAGADTIVGNAGDDLLSGGAGNDIVRGGEDDDTLSGGAGVNLLSGGAGDDTYLFSVGSGVDFVNDTEGANTLRFGPGINREAITASLANGADGASYLVLGCAGGESVFARVNFLRDDPAGGSLRFVFDDGSETDARSLLATGLAGPLEYFAGAAAIDISGGAFDDSIAGSALGDMIEGAGGNDILAGNAGDDYLSGGAGDDILLGGAGDDWLDGGAGADVYSITRGMGRDVALEAGDEVNVARVAAGLTLADLEARRSGDDLIIGIRNAADGLTLRDYYVAPSGWRLETAQGTGATLEEFLAVAAPAPVATGIEQARAGFEARLREYLAARLALAGYSPTDSGSFARDVLIDAVDLLRHTRDRVQLANVEETAVGGERYTQATPTLVIDTAASSQTTAQRTVTVSDNSGARFVSYALGGSVTGTRAPNGVFVGNFSVADFAAYGSPGGFAEPVFSQDVELGSGSPPDPNQSLGGLQRTLVGFFVHGADDVVDAAGISVHTTGAGAGYRPRTVTRTVTTTTIDESREATFSIVNVTGADAGGLLLVHGGALATGGAGDDVIAVDGAMQLPLFATEPTSGALGALMFGGDGNDRLYGERGDDVLIAGAGADLLVGGGGADRYLILPGSGTATVFDLRGGTGLGRADGIGQAPLAYVTMSGGTVELPAAARAQDLRFSWSDEWQDVFRDVNARHGTAYMSDLPLKVLTAVLTVSWGEGAAAQAVRIVMPHSDEATGSGISGVRLGDGSELSLATLLALAPGHSLDPNAAGNVALADNVDGEAGDDVLAGNGILRGGAGSDILTGGGGRDAISGDEGADSLVGGDGNDLLGFGIREFLGAGNLYRGGRGDDLILGTGSADLYLFERGDGADTVADFWHDPNFSPVAEGLLPEMTPFAAGPGINWNTVYSDAYYYNLPGADAIPGQYSGFDTLRLGAGITPGEVAFLRARAPSGIPDWPPVIVNDPPQSPGATAVIEDPSGPDLVIRVGYGSDSIRIPQFFSFEASRFNGYSYARMSPSAERNPLERIEFADGTVWDRADIDARLDTFGNRAPVVVSVIADQDVGAGELFSFELPNGVFVNPNPGDVLQMSVSGSADDSGSLPDWLAFDAERRRLAGTPGPGDVGDLRLVVRAVDPSGLFAESAFTLHVGEAAAVNHVPHAAKQIGSVAAHEDTEFYFRLPDDAFVDADGSDALAYRAQSIDTGGNPVELPAWLRFDALARAFIGMPSNADVGSVRVRVTAVDPAQAVATQSFDLVIHNTNDAPNLAYPLRDIVLDTAGPHAFALPADAFVDQDDGDWLRYSTHLIADDGSLNALPAWLSFDSASRAFIASPGSDGAGRYHLQVVATDQAQAQATGEFDLVVETADQPAVPPGGTETDAASSQATDLPLQALRPVPSGDAGGEAAGAESFALARALPILPVEGRAPVASLASPHMQGAASAQSTGDSDAGMAPRTHLSAQAIAQAIEIFNTAQDGGSWSPEPGQFGAAGVTSGLGDGAARNPGISRWALVEALARFHLDGALAEAAGASLADLPTNLGLGAVGLGGSNGFGSAAGLRGMDAANLRPLEGLSEGLARLGA